MEKTETKITHDKPNSYEFGPASARHKFFFNKVEELDEYIKAVKKLGLWTEP